MMKSLKSVSGDATYKNNIQFYILYFFNTTGIVIIGQMMGKQWEYITVFFSRFFGEIQRTELCDVTEGHLSFTLDPDDPDFT